MKNLAIALFTLALMPTAFSASFEMDSSCKNSGELTEGTVSVIEWKGNIEILGKIGRKKVTAIVKPQYFGDHDMETLIQEFRYNMRDGYTTHVELECSEGNLVDKWDITYLPKDRQETDYEEILRDL